ncbi:RNA polymerase sigma factor [Mycobacterium shigaense]|uniref:RNA polymerase sigma factor n=1 Tax=Mycobacterium shigaense TaxID=722731 RepID=A0A1Z4EJC1_9MYCO|nr:RNA polymerase sigma factor [Mycobacterium shigaense]
MREALDQLRVRKRRAEQPLADAAELDRLTAGAPADEDALLADSVSNAPLVVLDWLSRAQRVAFVLHDVFAVPFETIADLLGRSPAAAKKLASRARRVVLALPGWSAQGTRSLIGYQGQVAPSRRGDP